VTRGSSQPGRQLSPADGDGGAGLRRGAPDSGGVVRMERAVGFERRAWR
jgi:hypothetical protein